MIFFSNPILKQLPNKSSIIATKLTSTFFIPLKLSFYISLVLSIPYLIYNIWKFISPGLYLDERKVVFPIVLYSMLLFYFGLFFAFYIVSPLAINFFINSSPANVLVMTDIGNYMDFIFTISISCGFSFQTPVIIRLILNVGLFTKEELYKKRPYIIVFAFILGMLLTPPDFISQILLAIPICILFEIGLFIS